MMCQTIYVAMLARPVGDIVFYVAYIANCPENAAVQYRLHCDVEYLTSTSRFEYHAVMQRKAAKRQFLQSARAWNERARLVESPLFQQSDFFDPRDKVQVKYEMLRAALVDGVAVSEVSHQFGYSRETFYTSAQLFSEQGVVGLADGKRGPKQPRKLTPEVQGFLVEEIESNPALSGRELAARIADKLAVRVHHRSVERFRSAHGKKNRRGKR